MKNNSELRRQLFDITEKNKHLDHPGLILNLKNKFPNSIELEESVEKDYANCFMYALGLRNSTVIHNILKRNSTVDFVKFGSDFMRWLIEQKYLVQNSAGQIIIYKENEVPKHAGIIKGTKIISKWGMGNIWRHDILEVPISYGNDYEKYDIKYNTSVIEQGFVNWIKLKFKSI